MCIIIELLFLSVILSMPIVRFSTTSINVLNLMKGMNKYSKSIVGASVGFALGLWSMYSICHQPSSKLQSGCNIDYNYNECLDCGCLNIDVAQNVNHTCKNKMDPEIVSAPIDLYNVQKALTIYDSCVVQEIDF
jgi:hypothetical protein